MAARMPRHRNHNTSIRRKIRWGFSFFVALFILNGIVTIAMVYRIQSLNSRLAKVIQPSLKTEKELEKMIIELKMHATNLVFLDHPLGDAARLNELHDVQYPRLKEALTKLSTKWPERRDRDSLDIILQRFDGLFQVKRSIIYSMNTTAGEERGAARVNAEGIFNQQLLPRAASLASSLQTLYDRGESARIRENERLASSSQALRAAIIFLTVICTIAGYIHAARMTKSIVTPLNRIRCLVNDLSKGVIRKIGIHGGKDDEIEMMARSINHLSDNLMATAGFAQEIGLRNFDMPFTPLSDEDTLGKSLLAMRDNLKASEMQLAINNSELARKNKELEQFAFVASHDLQEPLKTSASFVQLLKRQYTGKLDEKADIYLNYISQSSERMQTLINDLLEHSRIGTRDKPEPVDCNVILEEVKADLDLAIAQNDATIASAPLPVVNGHRTELKRLFQSLIHNSIKFRKSDSPPLITIGAWNYPDAWQFSFCDNGIGISAEHYEKIFVIFQRLHLRNQYPGSGIGLSHCKKIVELHKGKIWIDSKPGQGSTFYFTIPHLTS